MTKKAKIVITSKIHQEGMNLLKRETDIVFPDKPLNLLETEDFLEMGKDSDAIIAVTSVEKITREVIEGLPKLRIIARHGVGYDNVDVKTASKRGIYVTVTPVLEETVADHAFALLLCLARRICIGQNHVVSKEWKVRDPFRFMGVDIWGKTAGIIGLGKIGSRIAERARGFKMKILYCDVVRKRDLEEQLGVEFRPLSALLKTSDIVFVALPLNKETHNMINREELRLMKKTAFLINVARGAIVNHDALVEALQEKRIAGAGLDVFEKEPIPRDDPLLDQINIVLTPHIASNTIECRKRMATTVAEEVLRVIHGERPKHAINPTIDR